MQHGEGCPDIVDKAGSVTPVEVKSGIQKDVNSKTVPGCELITGEIPRIPPIWSISPLDYDVPKCWKTAKIIVYE